MFSLQLFLQVQKNKGQGIKEKISFNDLSDEKNAASASSVKYSLKILDAGVVRRLKEPLKAEVRITVSLHFFLLINSLGFLLYFYFVTKSELE